MKKIVSLLLVMLLLVSLLPGCKKTETIWIVMEEHKAMEQHVRSIIKLFKEQNPNVEFELELLPNGNKVVDADYEEARTAILQRLRSAIMARKGPDIYLLPSTTTTYEMLFEDVNLAMRNGLFEDISEYYDGDTELRTEELISGVMDAGVLDGRRYILPLRYEMPVAYVDVSQFKALGGSLDMFDGGIMELYKDLLATGNSELIAGAFVSYHAMRSFAMNFCGDVINYDEREVQLTAEELAEFVSTVQTVRMHEYVDPENWEQKSEVIFPSVLPHLFSGMEYWTAGTSMYIGKMQDLMDNAAYARTHDVEIAMIPLASADGKVTADVTYFGAVGDSCDDVELAYEFLRLFLTEEGQWIENTDTAHEAFYHGWPVRAKGGVGLLWQKRNERLANVESPEWDEETKLAIQELKAGIINNVVVLDDEDLPILDVAVDRVQLSIDLENVLNDMLIGLNDSATNEAIPADIDAMAAQWLEELEWHLGEG